MSNPYDETNPDQQRPQPQYGAYADRSEGPDPSSDQPSSPYAGTGGQHNPYGEPAWGQPGGGDHTDPAAQPNPYGQPAYGNQQPGYGSGWQQPAQPGPEAYPGGAPAQKPQRPVTLVVAMVLMLAAGLLSLAWGIYVLFTMQAQDASELMSEQMRETMVNSFQSDPQLQELSPEEALDMALLGLGSMALVWSIVLLAIYVTLAFVGTMTGNVGRVLATIWMAGSLLFLLLGLDSTSFWMILVVVGASLAALVLLWLPASNQHVHQRRAYKEARRRSSYTGYGGYPGGGGYPGAGQPPAQTGAGQAGPYGTQPGPYDQQSNPYGQNSQGPQ